MTFNGEAAKTKKQAEKNAAMAAWSALKQCKFPLRTPYFSISIKVGSGDSNVYRACRGLVTTVV